MFEEVKSVEEFICKKKRYPNSQERQALHDILWNDYIGGLTEDEKKIALENAGLSQQPEIIRKIQAATERLRNLLTHDNNVISVDFYERWGDYRIRVTVISTKREQLYLFRRELPNFFEGWSVELFPTTKVQKLLTAITKFWKR